MNNSYITIIKEKRTVLSRKRVPLNQNECTADFRIGVPFEQNLHSMNYHTNISSILYNSRVIIRLLACTFATIFPPRMATSVFTTASPNPVLPLCLDLSPV